MSANLPSKCGRILIAIDDSQAAEWAAQVGRQLARQLSAKVMLVHVVEAAVTVGDDFATEQQCETIERQQGKELLARMSLSFAAPDCAETELRIGSPSDQICAMAREWNADFIVIGTRGRGRIAQFVLGSTVEAIIRQSPCPVITVAHDPCHDSTTMDDRFGVVAEPIAARQIPIAPNSGTRTCDWIDGEIENPHHTAEGS
jgi:nucleotide-binding universal stress UspA family protein